MGVPLPDGHLHGVVLHVVTGGTERERVVPRVTSFADVLLGEEVPVGETADVGLLAPEIRDFQCKVADDFLLDRKVPLLGREVLKLARGGDVKHAAGVAQRSQEEVDGNAVDVDRRIHVARYSNEILPGRYKTGLGHTT